MPITLDVNQEGETMIEAIQESKASELTHNGTSGARAILVVEDDLFMQRILGRIIRSLDLAIKPVYVKTAEEAQAMIDYNVEDFCAIVADQYLLGRKTGWDLWANNLKSDRYLPFLMTSGEVNFDRAFAKRAEKGWLCPKYIRKPFRHKEFQEALKEVLFDNTQPLERNQKREELEPDARILDKKWSSIAWSWLFYFVLGLSLIGSIALNNWF